MQQSHSPNHFCPDDIKGHPYSVEVEILLGGIPRAMFDDGTMQFLDQGTDPVMAFSPRLDEDALEAFCEAHIEKYRAHHDQHRHLIADYETPGIEQFWS